MTQFKPTTLKITDLSCTRGDRDLFENLNFSLQSGEVLQIAGQNGCGKTSLLRILSGLMTASAGNIFWDNCPVNESDYKQDFIYFGHHSAIKDELTALENLQFARKLQNDNGKDLFEILARFTLAGFEDIPCHFLSAGQKRRVGLARLLISNCPLWILDEPFTALDKDGVKDFEQICHEHIELKGMIILTTHQSLQSLNATILNLNEYAVEQ